MKAIASILLLALFSTTASATVNIDMVPLGNPGNAPDYRFSGGMGFGSVGYNYQIGKYEVTAGQYTEFLNAVAKADPNGLYNSSMGTPLFGSNIVRTDSSPNFRYSVAADWANRPVNYTTFWDAARFANWLQNGQPIGDQGPGTTEDGAYHDVGNQSLFGRNAGAKFFLPTENEWYKAAYFDRTAGTAGRYFNFPTGTDSLPGSDINETTNAGNNANWSHACCNVTYLRTLVGEFELSASPYGTFDQAGNVSEWNETKFGSSHRVVRGGSWPLPRQFICMHPAAASGFLKASTPNLASASQVFLSQVRQYSRP
jgi:formylglycine-generating enzyme